MKLLREFVEPNEIDNIVNKETKDIFLKGVFTQQEIKNRNGRIYPGKIMEREIYKIQKKIADTGLTGELDHPAQPEYKYENACFVINKINKDGNNYLGEAKILREGKGKLAYNLAKEGIKFGISSRGLGSLNENKEDGILYVCEDFNLITFDIVGEPSCYTAVVDSILEQKEWIIDDSGYIKEDKLAEYKKKIESIPKARMEEELTKVFNQFIADF